MGEGQRSTIIENHGAATTKLIAIPDGIRGFTAENLKLKSASGSGQGACLYIGENFGEVRLVGLDIHAYGSAAGIQQNTGTGIHLLMENIRVNGGTRGFDLTPPAINTPINTIVASACYANDCVNDGWTIRNSSDTTLIGCSADNCGQTATGYGFQINGNHSTLINCSAENNGNSSFNSGGYYMAGGQTMTMIGCTTYNQGLAFHANASSLRLVLQNCRAQSPIAYGSALTISNALEAIVIGGDFANIGSVAALTRRFAGVYAANPEVQVQATTLALSGLMAGNTYSNEGAAAIVPFTLPSARVGYKFAFIVQDADGIRVTAASGDTIRINGSVSAAAGKIESTTVGSVVELLAINATEWVATRSSGTWTVT